jgi:hypothetical protein
MSDTKIHPQQTYSFVVRIWWEEGLTRIDGRPLWRGQVERAGSGQTHVFQSLDDLLRFIQTQSGISE